MNWIIILAVLITGLFVLQHYNSDSWDFKAYVLNGEYWFNSGSYFEPLRPPLVPFVLGVLDWTFNRTVAEYGFIILASLLFAFSSIKLARALKFNPVWFYALSANFYLLTIGLFNGTELVSLAFLELAIAGILTKKQSGVFLGLSILSRYTALSYVPLLFLHKKAKPILVNFALLALSLAPWFAYNYFAYDNMFLSIADQFANNVYFRDYIVSPPQWSHFLNVLGIFIPFAILGLVLSFKSLWKNRRQLLSQPDIIFLFIAVLAVDSYLSIPIKSDRYLFNLVLPVIFWSYKGLQAIAKRFSRKHASFIVAILCIVSMIIALDKMSVRDTNEKIYTQAITDIKLLGFGNCSVASNAWVSLAYYGLPSQDSPRERLLNQSISAGEIVVLFSHVGEPDYAKNTSFISQFQLQKRTDNYVILGSGCAPIQNNDQPYVEKLADTVFAMDGYRTEERPCHLLLKNPVLVRFCEFVNGGKNG